MLMEFLDGGTGHKKTRLRAGSFRCVRMAQPAYPADMSGCGRRAREVMPAASQALVMTIGWAEGSMDMECGRNVALNGKDRCTGFPARLQQPSGISGAAREPQSSGVTVTRTRNRVPGS